MKLKRTGKLLALLLAVVMVCSLLPVTALADDVPTLIIDLTNYTGSVSGTITFDNGSVISLVPSQKNIIPLRDEYGNMVITQGESVITLDNFQVGTNIENSWSIEGLNESYIEIIDGKVNLFILGKKNKKFVEITLDGNKILIADQFDLTYLEVWETNSITITPIFSDNGGYTLNVKPDDETHGTVNKSETQNENEYLITATPNDGYSFAYWLKDTAEDTAENRITESPYTVTLEADATFTAYFRERYTLTAESEDTAKGTAVAQYTGASNGVDNYTLTATPADYYAFDKWTCGNDEYIDNPLDVSVSESGKTYTAHFSQLALSLEDGAAWKLVGSAANAGIANTIVGSQAGIPSVGSRCALFLPVSIPCAMEHVSIALSVADGQGQTLGECTIEDVTFDYAFSGYIDVRFDPAPAVSTVTASLTLTTPAGSSTSTKTYSGLTLADGAENDDYRYVTSPDFGYGDISIVDCGPNLYGAYGRTDAATGAAELYVYGQQGVFSYDPAGRPNLVNMGLTVPQGARIASLGGNGATGLTAAVVSADNVILYAWTGTDWTPIEGGSAKDEKLSSGGGVLVLDETDVWTASKHWNGESWTEHTYNFKSFSRSADAVYATDGSGQRWKYSDGAWTTAAEAPSADSVTGGGAYEGIGQNHKGDWYLFMEGRSHFVSDSTFYGYKGSDVYKWDGSKWVYQIMPVLNDPQDSMAETAKRIRPDRVDGVCVPMPGVSVMYGTQGRGALYLYVGDSTITFDPGEGRLLGDATLTAPILSEIDVSKVPDATRNNYVFGGWYYDEACTVKFDADSTAMPGADVTLYAKWTERAGLSDELAFYRERALNALAQQLGKYSETDYSEANWAALQKAYTDGVAAINAAKAGTEKVDGNIEAALNEAAEAMRAVPKLDKPRKNYITVAVSMDANTLGLGYLIEPTLVTVEEGTPASKVITDLLAQTAREKYGVTAAGYTTYHESEPAAQYPWMMTGSVDSDFYLAQVYFPEQRNYKLPDFIASAIGGMGFNASDASGNYLGEFDYLTTSGWVYSIGDKTGGNASFPGIGASGWTLSDGEVMRWQFTLVGYGSDLNADNTQWGAQSMIPTLGDKSALTWRVAEINAAGEQSQYGDAYDDAIAVLTDAEATQREVDAALAALNGSGTGSSTGSSTGSGATAGSSEEEEVKLSAEDVKKAADENGDLAVETKNGTVTLDAETLDKLAETGEEVVVSVTENEDGTVTVDVTAGDERVDAPVKVALPADAGRVPVIVNADGTEEILKKSVVEDGKAYAEIPAGATVKLINNDVSFADVPANAWYAEAVEFVASRGIFEGTNKGFEPYAPMTRAMLATVLYRLEDATAAGTNPFADVQNGLWYTEGVIWASGAGIVEGTNKGFEPNENVTREQIATMLYRYAQYVGLDTSSRASLSGFPDGGQTAAWAKDAMEWAVSVGLIEGDERGLNPQGDATRAQVATVLERMIKLMVK